MKFVLIFPNLNLRRNPLYHIHFHQPLGIAYIASVLRKEGHDVHVVDALAENLNQDEVLGRLSHDLAIIGISTNISNSHSACMLARRIRHAHPRRMILMGGPWASIEHERILSLKLADIVVIGEGERTIVELANRLPNGIDSLADVAGLAYRSCSGEIMKTAPRQLIEDLDSIPFPAWDLFPSYKFYPFIRRKEPHFPIMTSRGCPMDCNHCTKCVHGYAFRKRSVENVIRELIFLKRTFGLGQVFVTDDTFTLDKARAECIFDEIIKLNLNISITFANGLRADSIDVALGQKMKDAGVVEVALGIESGNQEIVNRIGKKLDLRYVIRAVKILKSMDINTMGFFILGHPWDTPETMAQTFHFAKQLDIDHPFFFRAIAFPGTRLYDLVKEHGRFINENDTNFESYNLGNATFEIYDLKTKDLNKAFKRSYALFFLRPTKILKLMRAAKSFFEVKWLLFVFLDFLYNYADKILNALVKVST